MTEQQECQNCSAGTYNEDKGQIQCKVCALGLHQPEEQKTLCLECEAGRYTDETAQRECQNCSAGTYNEDKGTTKCDPCGTGTYQPDEQKTLCFDCEAGKFTNMTEQQECQNCSAGTYNEVKGLTQCTACGTGKYQPLKQKTLCFDCEAGKYTNQTKQTQCKECESGRSNNETGKTSCTVCARGLHQPDRKKTLCISCEAGQFSNEIEQTACKPCAKGRFNEAQGLTECSDCKPGQYQPDEQKTLCFDCEAGRYTNQTKQIECEDCEAGKSNPDKKKTSCSNCHKDHYQSETGKTQCIEMSKLQVPVLNRCFGEKEGCAEFTNCERGTVKNQVTLACDKCAPGKDRIKTQEECQECETGRHRDENDLGQEKNPLNGEAKVRNCKACKAGFFQPDPAQATCRVCPAGWNSKIESKECELIREWDNKIGGPCTPLREYKLNSEELGCPQPKDAKSESVSLQRYNSHVARLQWVHSESSTWKYGSTTGAPLTGAKLTGWEVEMDPCYELQDLNGSQVDETDDFGCYVGCETEKPSLKVSQDERYLLKKGGDKDELCDVERGDTCKLDRTKPCVFRLENSSKIHKSGYVNESCYNGDKDNCLKISSYHLDFHLKQKVIESESLVFRVRPRAELNTEERYGAWSLKSPRFTSVQECGKTEYLNDTTGDLDVVKGDQKKNSQPQWHKMCGKFEETNFDVEFAKKYFSGDALFRAMRRRNKTEIQEIRKKRRVCLENNPEKWKCHTCPAGGSCVPNVTSRTILPKFGYWKNDGLRRPKSCEALTSRCLSNVNSWFLECRNPHACLGGPWIGTEYKPTKVKAYFEKYANGDEKGEEWFQKVIVEGDATLGCDEHSGYARECKFFTGVSANGTKEFLSRPCLKCQTCTGNYSRTRLTECEYCYDGTGAGEDGKKPLIDGKLKVALVFTAVVGVFAFMTGLKVRSQRRDIKAVHSTMKRILVSHIQTLSLVYGFNVSWPDLLDTIIYIMTSVVTLTNQIGAIECDDAVKDVAESSGSKHANIFYSSHLGMLATPYLMMPFLWIYWIYIAPCSWVFKCGNDKIEASEIDYLFLCRSSNDKELRRYGVHAQNIKALKDEEKKERLAKETKRKTDRKEMFERAKKNEEKKRHQRGDDYEDESDDEEFNSIGIEPRKKVSLQDTDKYFTKVPQTGGSDSPRKSNLNEHEKRMARKFRQNRNSKITTFDTFCMSMIMVFYLLTPTLTGAALDLFNCETIGDEDRLAADLQVICWKDYHLFVVLSLGVPSAAMNIIVFPALLFSYLKYQDSKGKLHPPVKTRGDSDDQSIKTLYRFGLYYNGYTGKRWWYELTVIYRKILMGVLVTFGSILEEQQMHIALCLIVLFLFLNLHLRPFTFGLSMDKEEHIQKKVDGLLLHRLEYLSIITMFAMIWSGVLFNLTPNCKADSEGVIWCQILMGGVIAANFGYVIYGSLRCVQAFAKNLKEKHSQFVQEKLGQVKQAIIRPRLKSNAGSMEASARGVRANFGFNDGEEENDGEPDSVIADNIYGLADDYFDEQDQSQIVHSNPLARGFEGGFKVGLQMESAKQGSSSSSIGNSIKGVATTLRAAAKFKNVLQGIRFQQKRSFGKRSKNNQKRNVGVSGQDNLKGASVRGAVTTLRAAKKFKKLIRKESNSNTVQWVGNPVNTNASSTSKNTESMNMETVAAEKEVEMRDVSSRGKNRQTMRTRKKLSRGLSRRGKGRKQQRSKQPRKSFALQRSLVNGENPEEGKGSNPVAISHVINGDSTGNSTSAYQRAKLAGKTFARELFEEPESGRLYAVDTIGGVQKPAHWIVNEALHFDHNSGRIYTIDAASGKASWVHPHDAILD